MKIKATDIENLMTAIFFFRRKSHIGRHLRRHCRLLPLIPMTAWSVCIVTFHNIFQESFSTSLSLWLMFILFFNCIKTSFSTYFPIFLPTQPCLLLCSICANIGHSHTMRLTVSSTLPHNLHLFSTWVLSISCSQQANFLHEVAVVLPL